MAKTIVLSQEKQVILNTLEFLGVESILVREPDGAVIVTRSARGSLNGTMLGRKEPEGSINENYLFPELLELENHSCLKITDLIENYCPDFPIKY